MMLLTKNMATKGKFVEGLQERARIATERLKTQDNESQFSKIMGYCTQAADSGYHVVFVDKNLVNDEVFEKLTREGFRIKDGYFMNEDIPMVCIKHKKTNCNMCTYQISWYEEETEEKMNCNCDETTGEECELHRWQRIELENEEED